MRKEFLEVGEVVAAHGVRGEMRVYPWCDPGDLEAAKNLYFDKGALSFKVERARPHKNIYIVKLSGVDTPEEAIKLRGKIAYMRRSEIPLGEGDYFIQDLLGLKVLDADTGEEYGELSDVAPTGANDVYCVRRPSGEEVWIPAIRSVIVNTDLDEGRMMIRPMKGLFDQ